MKHGGQLVAASRRFSVPVEKWIDFSVNLNVLGPSLSKEDWASIYQAAEHYPENLRIREQLSELYSIPEKYVQPTAGGIEALYLAMASTNSNRIIGLAPSFVEYAQIAKRLNRAYKNIRNWPSKSFQALDIILSESLPGDLVVLCQPNNPTGELIAKDKILQVICSEHGQKINWLIDEAFIEFCDPSNSMSLMNSIHNLPNVIICRSLTKTWNIPGLRLGFVCSSNAFWMENIRSLQLPWTISNPALKWCGKMLNMDMQNLLMESLFTLKELKEKFISELEKIHYLKIFSGAANFLFIELRDKKFTSRLLYEYLGERGILIRTCDNYEGISPNRFIRIAIKTEGQNARLLSALKQLR